MQHLLIRNINLAADDSRCNLSRTWTAMEVTYCREHMAYVDRLCVPLWPKHTENFIICPIATA